MPIINVSHLRDIHTCTSLFNLYTCIHIHVCHVHIIPSLIHTQYYEMSYSLNVEMHKQVSEEYIYEQI